jgi:hypothetical protein
MLENIVQAARGIDHRVLDELNSTDTPTAQAFKKYLHSLESLATHWGLISPAKF